MEPLVSDESLIKCWDNPLASHGLQALRMSLYMSVLSAMKSLLFDECSKTASLYNLFKMLDDRRLVKHLKESRCKPFEVTHLNDDQNEDIKKMIEDKIYARHEKQSAEDFDQRLSAVRKDYEQLRDSELAGRVRGVRDRMIAHYQVISPKGERRLYNPADFGLKWGDASELMAESKTIVFEVSYIVSGSWYSADDHIAIHKDIAGHFWGRVGH